MRMRLVPALAATLLLAACAYGPPGAAPVQVAGVPDNYEAYYDGFYGPFADGYWGDDANFYFQDSGHHWVRDDGQHFRHAGETGFSRVHGSGVHREH
jgi:hypothetical protein